MSLVNLNFLKEEAIQLLIQIINTPSISKKEKKVSVLIENYLSKYGFHIQRKYNNIWTESTNYATKKENIRTILLNSHHDTIKPGKNWKTDPFTAIKKEDQLIGLGSNDAGASVVSLIATFIYLSSFSVLPYRLVLSITAEEEISGSLGVQSILPELGFVDLGIIGEPTKMQVAIAEKGLIVLDCIAKGKTGHSAKNTGINAIYIATKDIEYLRNFQFDRKSKILGLPTLTVTKIKGGIQHNVIPDFCSFVIDIRTNELYSNEELIEIIQKNICSKTIPRSSHLNYSFLDKNHPIVLKSKSIGIKTYGSTTLSDQSLMPFPTIKMGVGDSKRSHTPNEYVLISEIIDGIDIYIRLLKDFQF
ncbi:MAG: M20 family metallo-hydrolase [Flavobacteriales bacterium]|jgi:acetylornithine deacetylase|uniref:M20 family metallo-hydrolase n=1 Tax=Blattabacterium sp. (Mastotermes darwiniensis) TaxID=39768 RepID=UPI000231DF64|nr:M20 family metallo-hydrolase [Blattabacterium sp. (Mastotermes darwiniensis)]AER40380.1 acetylornithine deacetylase/succinyl-diaminopimelate desuccinylase [Blattabacterium sp. (Mastotermes darwiniensis) str. MADAR]MDR1804899.1 M20 family metallo-hydrolase [Flavobacteriales bacterium]